MIPFFRRIRRKLANDNQFLKYSRYAIGEIVLVVIGILIALQINTWNEQKKNRATVNTYLNNLIQDLQSDIKIIEGAGHIHAFRYHSLQYLMKLVGLKKSDSSLVVRFNVPDYPPTSDWDNSIPTQYDKDFIEAAFLWSTQVMLVDLNRNTLDEMKNNGIYSQIKDKNLKNQISFYYQEWDRRLGRDGQKKFLDITERWEASLGEEGLLSNSINTLEDPLQPLKNNDKRLYLLKRIARESGWFALHYYTTIDDTKKLTEAIEIYLKGDVKK